MIPVEHKSFEHGNERDLRAALDREASKYRDSSVTHNATTTTTNAPTVSGEHIHHHVHEHVQPVLQKEVISPQIVHTTIPIHETHHAAAVHHGTSILPAKTLEEFQTARGTLDGREKIQLSDFEGCPPTYNKDLQNEQLEADRHMHSHTHSHGMSNRENMTGNRGMETSGRDSGYAGGRNEGLSSSRGEYTTGMSGRNEGLSSSRGEFITGSSGRNEGMRENITGGSGRNEGLSSSRDDMMTGQSTGQSGVQSQRFVGGGGGLVGGNTGDTRIGTTGNTGSGRTGNLGSDVCLTSHPSSV